MNWQIADRPLTWFVLLSFGLHLSFFANFGKSAGAITTRYLGQSVLRVQIQDSTQDKGPILSKTASRDPPSKGNHSGFIASVPTTPQVAEVLPTSSRLQAAMSEQDPTSDVATEAGTRNQLLGELQTHLSKFLVYPPLARRRGWEGTVLLGLRVEPNGHLDGIHIERSSGYAVLDHSALNSLIRLGYLAEASGWLNGQDINMQLPVIYRLIEN